MQTVRGIQSTLRAQQVWAIRFWLDRYTRLRDRALFDVAIGSKLRGRDVVNYALAMASGLCAPHMILVRRSIWPAVGRAMARFRIKSTIQWQTQCSPHEQACQAERVSHSVQSAAMTSPKVDAVRCLAYAPA